LPCSNYLPKEENLNNRYFFNTISDRWIDAGNFSKHQYNTCKDENLFQAVIKLPLSKALFSRKAAAAY